MSLEQTLAEIRRGTEEILVEDELIEKLKSGKKLRIKAGFDPTAPDLHLGHTVLMNKMRRNMSFKYTAVLSDCGMAGLISETDAAPQFLQRQISVFKVMHNKAEAALLCMFHPQTAAAAGRAFIDL